MSDDPLNPDALAALRARFQAQSQRAQAYYNVMHEARRIAGGDEAANAWMNTALDEFEGKTPAQLVDASQEERVLAYLQAHQRAR